MKNTIKNALLDAAMWVVTTSLSVWYLLIVPICKRIWALFRGILSDFWMVPLAIFLIKWQAEVTAQLNLMPTLNDVKIGNIVPSLVVFLLMMTLVRSYYFFQYHDVYNDSLMRIKNEKWQNLSPWQQFLSLRLERWILIIAFAIIYLAQF